MLIETTRYELPPEGITLLGYIVRRMHKTEWLARVPAMLGEGESARALESSAVYAMAASTSYGRAYYQPASNRTGEEIREKDPNTGAMVTARLERTSPHYDISYEAVMPNGDTFKGSEEITGTTVGLRGLGMPAPSRFEFASGDYRAEFTGTITSELSLSLFGRTRIRAYGFLEIKDNMGNRGRMELDRSGDMLIQINEQPATHHSMERISWKDGEDPAGQPA